MTSLARDDRLRRRLLPNVYSCFDEGCTKSVKAYATMPKGSRKIPNKFQ